MLILQFFLIVFISIVNGVPNKQKATNECETSANFEKQRNGGGEICSYFQKNG